MNELETESLYLEYFSMGDGRKLADLAQNTGISANTLYKLSAKYKWNARARIDTEALKESVGDLDIENLSASERLSAISQESLLKVQNAIKKVPIKTVKDAQVMLNIAQLTASRPNEITALADSPGKSNYPDLTETIYRILPEEWADKLLDELAENACASLFGDDPSYDTNYN